MNGAASADLEARAAIADVLALYCHAIDRRRWDLMDACFHDDASYAFGPIAGSWRAFVEAARKMIDPLPVTHHQIGQTFFVIEGDRADTETYLTATHQVAADAAPDAAFPGRGEQYQSIIAGRYVDVFERRGYGWRIARRVGVIDWRRDVTLSAGALPSEAPPAEPDPALALRGTHNARPNP